MIVEEICMMAERLGIDTTPPVGARFNFGCSYAGWVMGEIERELGTEHGDLPLGLRLTHCQWLARSYA